jgi:hypothetical protein
MGNTFASMHFNWKRWILKEHTTQFIWICGITLILLLKFPELTSYNRSLRNELLIIILSVWAVLYIMIRILKKTGRFVEN